MSEQSLATKNTYLSIDFNERKDAFRAAGKLENGDNALEFDETAKAWFAKPGTDLNKLRQWMPDPQKGQLSDNANPVAEFGAALAEAGFELDGLPEMDGKKHRVRTVGDKKGEKTGVYAGYLDGVPAGWYQDHRIHEKPVKWVSTGKQVNAESQSHLRAIAAQNRFDREAALQKQYAHNGRRAAQVYAQMPDADGSQPYLANKGVKAFSGVKTDKKNRVVIPLQNEQGEIKTLQRISGNGFKSLKKNGQKTGNFFVVGGELKDGEPILYAEGYSTSASISEATSRPVVMTVDAGNLPKVAEKLKEKFPNSLHVVLGDDDRDNRVNKGKEKAEEAAQLTGGIYAVPVFSKEDKQNHLTDFNDLHKSQGLDAVRNQIEGVITANTHKAEEMNEETKTNIEAGPVITENFDKEMEAALNVSKNQSVERQPLESETATDEYSDLAEQYEYFERDDEPSWDYANSGEAYDGYVPIPAAMDETQPNEVEEENSVEPFIEQQKSQTADDEVKAWLTSRRVSTADMLAEDNARSQAAEKENSEANGETEEPKPKRQTAEQDYFSEGTTFKPVIPDRVAKSYIEVEGKFYFQNRPDSLAFVDKGARLQTKLNNNQVAGSLVDIAEARGWTEIQVKGTEEFRREAWLQATARGLTAHGYKPKEEDLARLKKVAGERNINEIEAREVADNVKKPVNSSQVASSSSAGVSNGVTDKATKSSEQKSESVAATDKSPTVEKVNKLAGKLVEHGAAPYEHNKDNKNNYYVTLENSDGQQSTTWGIDLQRAMSETNAQKGDHIELENLGRKPVSVDKEIKDDSGKVIKTETINTYRNKWEVKADVIRDQERPAQELVREHPDLVNEITAVKLAEKVSKNLSANDQERFMSRVRGQLADKVASGEKGPELKIKEVRSVDNANVKHKDAEIER